MDQTPPSEDMEKENAILLTVYFYFHRTYIPTKWQILLSLVFFVIYLASIARTFDLTALLWNDPHLHVPMYLFLENLAFADF